MRIPTLNNTVFALTLLLLQGCTMVPIVEVTPEQECKVLEVDVKDKVEKISNILSSKTFEMLSEAQIEINEVYALDEGLTVEMKSSVSSFKRVVRRRLHDTMDKVKRALAMVDPHETFQYNITGCESFEALFDQYSESSEKYRLWGESLKQSIANAQKWMEFTASVYDEKIADYRRNRPRATRYD